MFKRFLISQIEASLADTPVIFVGGPRQSGKTTLVSTLPERTFLTLDTAAVSAAARNDPEGFIFGLPENVTIDEVQRAPELFPAIKQAVDRDRKLGKFLLTGSADVLLVPRISESLAGRMALHTLWPLAQAEIAETSPEEWFFDDSAFTRTAFAEVGAGGFDDLVDRVTRGGFPEPFQRKSVDRRDSWFEGYVTTIIERDIRELADIERHADLPRLLTLLALRAASVLNGADLARDAGLSVMTTRRYCSLLEAVFLVGFIPAWHVNTTKRLVKSPKILLTDTGLATFLWGRRSFNDEAGRRAFGRLVQNFVGMELIKRIGWIEGGLKLFHYRTQAGQEVDWVLENRAGQIVGVEVKPAATVGASDLKGLKSLAADAGPAFKRGIILYGGTTTVPFGNNLFACPIGKLWT